MLKGPPPEDGGSVMSNFELQNETQYEIQIVKIRSFEIKNY